MASQTEANIIQQELVTVAAPIDASGTDFSWVPDFVAPAFGVFIGVIAGVYLAYRLQLILFERHDRRTVGALVMELMLNVEALDDFLRELRRLRDAINGGTLPTYFGYIALGKLLFVTPNAMLTTGLLYRRLKFEEIRNLQRISRDFTIVSGEIQINSQVTQVKTQAEAGSLDQAAAIQTVDYWERTLEEAKSDLTQIVNRLKKCSPPNSQARRRAFAPAIN